MTKRYSIAFSEEHAKNRARNQEAQVRLLRWMGKDKSLPDLAKFLGIELKKLRNYTGNLNNGSHEHHALTDIILEKLP